MRGRKPRPTVLKLIEGNPGKRALNDREPMPCVEIPECPEYLDTTARAEWDRTSQVLAEWASSRWPTGRRWPPTASSTAAGCMPKSRCPKFGTIVKSPEKGFPMKSPYLTVADQALEAMRKFMVEFGLTPSSRSRIRVPDGGPAAG